MKKFALIAMVFALNAMANDPAHTAPATETAPAAAETTHVKKSKVVKNAHGKKVEHKEESKTEEHPAH